MTEASIPVLNLRHLRYFVAVAQELHFGRAAANLGISQPPLSEQIRNLEATLGTRLFQRTQRKVTLTSSGRVLLAEASRLLVHAERVGEVMAAARTGRSGQLFLGCVPTSLFSALPAILRAQPAALGALDIRVTEAHTAEIVAAVLDGRLDAGLVWEERVPPALSIQPLERILFIVALHRSHRLAGSKRVALAELAAEPLILPPRALTPHQFDRIHAGFRGAGLTPRIGQQANSIAAQLGFVVCGLGYALVPAHARKLAMADVVFVPLRESVESVPLSLIWNERRTSSQLTTFRRQLDAAFPPPAPARSRAGKVRDLDTVSAG